MHHSIEGKVAKFFPVINIIIGVFLIALFHFGIFPLSMPMFAFVSFIALLFAVLWTKQSFYLFIGLLPFELIALTPEGSPFDLRPYQLVGISTILGYMIHLVLCEKVGINWQTTKNAFYNFKNSLTWFDVVLLAIVASSFFSAWYAGAGSGSIKLSAVLVSCVFLYALTRVFARNKEDVFALAPYVFGSLFVVALYGIVQNILFVQGWNHRELMPGRPNATFTEPDWLSAYLAFGAAILLSSVFYLSYHVDNFRKRFMGIFTLYDLALFVTLASILTVARSGWLAMIGVSVLFLVLIFFRKGWAKRQWDTLTASWHASAIIGIFGISLLFISVFHLTRFELGSRLESTGGFQEITIACVEDVALPGRIGHVSELAEYNCEHILLEEISSKQSDGAFVKRVLRPDPNVSVRQSIWRESWIQINRHPFSGIGWGDISLIIGTDGNGHKLNASNIFFEFWLGAGVIGFLGVVFIFGAIIIRGVKFFLRRDSAQPLGVFLLLTTVAILVPNMFNSGQFLGFLWVWLAVVVSIVKRK